MQLITCMLRHDGHVCGHLAKYSHELVLFVILFSSDMDMAAKTFVL